MQGGVAEGEKGAAMGRDPSERKRDEQWGGATMGSRNVDIY